MQTHNIYYLVSFIFTCLPFCSSSAWLRLSYTKVMLLKCATSIILINLQAIFKKDDYK